MIERNIVNTEFVKGKLTIVVLSHTRRVLVPPIPPAVRDQTKVSCENNYSPENASRVKNTRQTAPPAEISFLPSRCRLKRCIYDTASRRVSLSSGPAPHTYTMNSSTDRSRDLVVNSPVGQNPVTHFNTSRVRPETLTLILTLLGTLPLRDTSLDSKLELYEGDIKGGSFL